MAKLVRHQRVVIALSVHILRSGVARCSDARVDVVEIRLALRCLLPQPGTLAARTLLGCRPAGERDRQGTGRDRGVQWDRPPATPRRLL